MFRRFADRVNDVVSNAASSLQSSSSTTTANTSDARVDELASLGFRTAETRHALRLMNGDMNRATDWLLENGSPITGAVASRSTSTAAISERAEEEEDTELQKAIQASLMTNSKQKNLSQTKLQKKRHQSAATRKAVRAAEDRVLNNSIKTSGTSSTAKDTSNNSSGGGGRCSLSKTHPKVQIPKRLSQHDQEDVILRCANRMAPYSLSVDTLLRSLKTIQSNKSNRKYHTIDASASTFQRSLDAPGVLDLLKAVNFHCPPGPRNNSISSKEVLTLSHYDAAAFYLGISALEQIQQTSLDYAKDKLFRAFYKELDDCLDTTKNLNDNEILARERYKSKLPTEPSRSGCQITVEFGISSSILNHSDNNNIISNKYNKQQQLMKFSRGFDHDDILDDVINWLGGYSSVIPSKLESGEWNVVDKNQKGSLGGGEEEDYNYRRVDVSTDIARKKTLQYMNCFPSGRIAIVPRFHFSKKE